jgi:PAS domain S-box-containing protein
MIVNKPDDCLRQPERLWESIFNSITDRISLQDCDCCIVNCNKAYADTLGKSPAEIIGKKCYELMHGTTEPIASCPHCSTITNGKTASFQVNDPATNKFYEVTTTPWKNEFGTLEGTIHITKDISDRVHAEFELEKTIERANDLAVKAELANIAKSHFLATMSHEIRTPLNGIVGMTDLLLDTALSSEQRNFVNIISTSGESLLSIIKDVLDYSKIEAGKMRLGKRPFDYRKIVKETIDMLAAKAQAKKIALSTRIDEGVPAIVMGDDTRTRQILLNLVNNAIKFTERGSVTIEVKTGAVTETSVELTTSVIDTGIGIETEGKTRLFKLFSQLDNSTEHKYGGTGLGLAICKKLVELNGGSIGVDSVPGKGSNFHFSVKFDHADEKKSAIPQDNGKILLNTADLLLTLNNDQGLLNEILNFFTIDMGKLIASMKDYLATNDLAQAKRIAHTIKGASLNVGAEEMADLTIAFESVCLSNTMQTAVIMEKLEQSFLSVEQTIGRRLAGIR